MEFIQNCCIREEYTIERKADGEREDVNYLVNRYLGQVFLGIK